MIEGTWIGEINSPLTVKKAKLLSINSYIGKYGMTFIHTFISDNNYLTWWTSKRIPYEIGTEIKIQGRVKSHDTYRGKRITRLTRCRINAE